MKRGVFYMLPYNGGYRMNIMTKKGSLDNIITYEHYCDTKADLANIPKEQITLGSVAIVLKDEGNEMGIYLANSNKEWISFSAGGNGGGSSMSDISLANLVDISLANPTDGQTLVYNEGTKKWENRSISSNNSAESDIMYITATNVNNNSFNIDKEIDEIFNHLNKNKIAMLIVRGYQTTIVPMVRYYIGDAWSEDPSTVWFEQMNISTFGDTSLVRTVYQIADSGSYSGSCTVSTNTIRLNSQ